MNDGTYQSYRSSLFVIMWQSALWSPTDGTDSHRVFYTNIMISYHLLVITWLGALWSPTDGADSHRAIYLVIKSSQLYIIQY